MRKSLEDVSESNILDKKYQDMSDDLREFEVYIAENGYCILCIPERFREAARSSPDDFEVPVPTKYVLSHKYSIESGYVYVDVPYDDCLGIDLPDDYYVY